MQYEKFRQYLLQGHKQSFADLCLRRAETIENAYGRTIDELTGDDMVMEDTLIALEHTISRDDLDNSRMFYAITMRWCMGINFLCV